MRNQPNKFECREVLKPRQRGRCVKCREWLTKAARAAKLDLCSQCYTQAVIVPWASVAITSGASAISTRRRPRRWCR